MVRSLSFARALVFFVAILSLSPAVILATPRKTLSAAQTRQALRTKVPVNYDDQPLGEVLVDIGNKIGADVEINTSELHAEGVTETTPVRLNVTTEISAHAAMKLILDQLRLAYLISEGGTIIVGGQPIDHEFEEVVYNVEGLVYPAGLQPTRRPQESTKQIVSLLLDTIDPGSWKDRGGKGTCSIVENRDVIVVRHTPAVHAQVGDLIDQVHRLKSVQVYFTAELVEIAPDDWQRQPRFENSEAPGREALLRHATKADGQKEDVLKVLSTRRLLAYNGEQLKLSTDANVAHSELVDQLLIQPVVTANGERVRLAVVNDRGRGKSNRVHRQVVTLDDGESVLVPLTSSAWAGEKPGAKVSCYRLTARVCVFDKEGSALVTTAPH